MTLLLAISIMLCAATAWFTLLSDRGAVQARDGELSDAKTGTAGETQ